MSFSSAQNKVLQMLIVEKLSQSKNRYKPFYLKNKSLSEMSIGKQKIYISNIVNFFSGRDKWAKL